MVERSISDGSVFETNDERRHRTMYGFTQQWYATRWQRMSGCGPTAVANIFYYLYHKYAGDKPDDILNDPNARLSFMEDIFKYVTPSINGISSAKMLRDGVAAYAKGKGLKVKTELMDIPKKQSGRPALLSVLGFIDVALGQDMPVAFLNLNHGGEIQLDSWHWVTILALEHTEDASRAWIEILDEGAKKKIDFANWYQTTTLGGGLVWFDLLDGAGQQPFKTPAKKPK